MPDLLQRFAGAALGVASLPLVVALAVLVRLDSPGPVLHRAMRIGRGGRPFVCFKIRTMRIDGEAGPDVTASDDPRVSSVGQVLRRLRLDELPQLWNVARGEMRLVGPRPEAPAFVDLGEDLHRRVFAATPGITGLAQLLFIDEASLLRGPDPDRAYRASVLPAKLQVDAAYLDRRSARLDLWILGRTIAAMAGGRVRLETVERRLGRPLPLARGVLSRREAPR
jgi:lipopolysaccharide/colanic/teichoic acid biosynthesis glycosyltransferase